MRLLGLADLRPAGATGRRVEASCRQAAQQARNAQSSFAMQPKAVVLKIDQLLSDVHTVSQVLIPHRIRYSTHTHALIWTRPLQDDVTASTARWGTPGSLRHRPCCRIAQGRQFIRVVLVFVPFFCFCWALFAQKTPTNNIKASRPGAAGASSEKRLQNC